MSGAFPPKLVGAGEGKTVMLFGVQFGVPGGERAARRPRWPRSSSPAGVEECFEKLAPILAAHRPAAEYYRGQTLSGYGLAG